MHSLTPRRLTPRRSLGPARVLRRHVVDHLLAESTHQRVEQRLRRRRVHGAAATDAGGGGAAGGAGEETVHRRLSVVLSKQSVHVPHMDVTNVTPKYHDTE